MAGRYFTGCAVWAFKDWVGSFYPRGSKAGDFLRLYGDRMTAVEGNTTFYSMPDAKTIDRWAATMPPGFRFCPKLPRAFSHQGKLVPFVEASHRFLQTLMPLGVGAAPAENRLGPLFIQLPPTYGPEHLADLRDFLARWPRQQSPIAVEVRHLGWFAEPHATRLNQLLTGLGVGRVLLDTRPIYDCINTPSDDPQIGSERKKPKLPLQPEVTAAFTIVRYISHPNLAYNQPYFDEWVPRLCQWLAGGTDVYFFAHCPQEARSPAVAREVYHQLQQAGAPLPPLLWDVVAQQRAEEEASSTQLSLFG
ncbi:DUF72 domain-containing protein [Leptolyngbya sp. KIOST-1]|uniref:DUF72 domain-containing protein n=1 Tax=Leptolyngbya sp. KIOST-1 TaxID=1229172 RepID=UPI00056AED85|nr:DUF72 domain-containing protein [Leptolyngbya sp. KIOST-1]